MDDLYMYSRQNSLTHSDYTLAPDGFVRRGEPDRLNNLLRTARAGNASTALVGPAWLKPQTESFRQAAAIPAAATARTREPMVVHGFFAVSAAGPALRVWDLETSETLNTLEGHTADVTAVALVEGRQVLSGARDKALRLWDLCTGRTVRTFEGHTDWVSAVVIVDERRALSGAGDGALRLWDLETGETLQILEGHRHGVAALGLASSNLAVSSSLDGTLRVWDLDCGQSVAILPLDMPVRALTANLLKLVEPE